MKKKTLALLVCFVLALTAVVALVACNKTVTYTVRFYNGTQKIKEVQIEEGKTIDASYKPDQDGKTFVAWYEDSSLAGEAYDVTAPVKSDLKLFGKWQSNTVETDSRIWYVMGNTVNANWDCATALNDDGEWEVVESLRGAVLQQKEGTNEFSIELTMRAGKASKFRFATQIEDKSTWAGENRAQAGLGNIEGFAIATGVNPEDGAEYTVDGANKWYGNVKKDNAIVFEGGRQYDDPTYMWNIFVTAESEGVYKFTLKTFPGEDADRDVITWEKVRDVEKLDKTFAPYITGGLTGWKTTAEETLAMTARSVNDAGEGKYTYTFDITTISETNAKEEFKVIDLATGAVNWIGHNGQGGLGESNFEITENGTWLFEIDSVNKTYKLEKAAIRVSGTIDGQAWADGSQRSEGYKHNMYVMNKVASATEGVEKYELVLEITSAHGASWLAEGKVAAIKVECNAAGYEIWGCGKGQNTTANIEFEALGVYRVTLELSYNAQDERQTNVTVTKLASADIPVAMIGNTSYNTLVDAVAAAQDGDAVVVFKDITSGGIKIDEARAIDILIELNGHTVTVGNPLVGSAGTVSQSIHIEKGNAVTICNGKITSEANSASMLVQNYCDLTLDNVILDGSKLAGTGTAYTLSNNFGTIVIKNGSKIIAREEKGVAFDLWYGMFAQYDEGISVTVEKGCVIQGAIEYGAASRITGTDWVEKASLVLPAGEYDIDYTSNGLTDEIANITIAPASAE